MLLESIILRHLSPDRNVPQSILRELLQLAVYHKLQGCVLAREKTTSDVAERKGRVLTTDLRNLCAETRSKTYRFDSPRLSYSGIPRVTPYVAVI